MVKLSKLQEYFEDTRFKVLEFKNLCKIVIDEQVKQGGKQLMASVYESSKDIMEENKVLTERCRLMVEEIRVLEKDNKDIREERESSEERYGRIMRELKGKLADSQGKDM